MAPVGQHQNYESVSIEDPSNNKTETLPPSVPPLKKRKKRAYCTSLLISSVTASAVLTISMINAFIIKEHVFHLDNNARSTTTNTSSSPACYKKEKKTNVAGLFGICLGLLSVIIGTLFDRLSLVVEERHHVATRYNGSKKMMWKACFSGVHWGPVVLLGSVTIVVVLGMIAAGKIQFQLVYISLGLSGIGLAPLVLRLLSLDTQSQVHISMIMEENETSIGNTLAWSYYISYLEAVLPKIQQAVEKSDWKHSLSSEKLFILIPLDCDSFTPLQTLDPRVSKVDTIKCDRELSYSIDVYSVENRESGPTEYFLIQYASTPLKSMRYMGLYERSKSLPESKIEAESKIFYTTLKNILIDKPLEPKCKNTCELISFESKDKRPLADFILERDHVSPAGQPEPDGSRPSRSNKTIKKTGPVVEIPPEEVTDKSQQESQANQIAENNESQRNMRAGSSRQCDNGSEGRQPKESASHSEDAAVVYKKHPEELVRVTVRKQSSSVNSSQRKTKSSSKNVETDEIKQKASNNYSKEDGTFCEAGGNDSCMKQIGDEGRGENSKHDSTSGVEKGLGEQNEENKCNKQPKDIQKEELEQKSNIKFERSKSC